MPVPPSFCGALVDYAGLFPPAKLAIETAAGKYAHYLASEHRYIMGRLVIPLSRLSELETRLHKKAPTNWEISALASSEAALESASLERFNARQSGLRIVSIEAKASSVTEVVATSSAFPVSLETWIELPPIVPNLPALVDALRDAGRGAKLRTGGITPEAFPASSAVVRFLRECHRAGVVMKATAGLHHPLTGEYPLTYEPGSPRGRMFGFVNLLLAAALVHTGGSDADALMLLDDQDADNFAAAPDAVAWRGHRFTDQQLASTRRSLFRSFGSCSFTEPIEGLQQLHWL